MVTIGQQQVLIQTNINHNIKLQVHPHPHTHPHRVRHLFNWYIFEVIRQLVLTDQLATFYEREREREREVLFSFSGLVS